VICHTKKSDIILILFFFDKINLSNLFKLNLVENKLYLTFEFNSSKKTISFILALKNTIKDLFFNCNFYQTFNYKYNLKLYIQ